MYLINIYFPTIAKGNGCNSPISDLLMLLTSLHPYGVHPDEIRAYIFVLIRDIQLDQLDIPWDCIDYYYYYLEAKMRSRTGQKITHFNYGQFLLKVRGTYRDFYTTLFWYNIKLHKALFLPSKWVSYSPQDQYVPIMLCVSCHEIKHSSLSKSSI